MHSQPYYTPECIPRPAYQLRYFTKSTATGRRFAAPVAFDVRMSSETRRYESPSFFTCPCSAAFTLRTLS